MLSPLLRRSSSANRTLLSSFLRRFSSAATSCGTIVGATHDGKVPSPEPHFMVEYLMSRCGFPPDKASKASTHLRGIRSPDQPDSVFNFFKSHGFEDSQINKIVGCNPRCLRLNVDKMLAPKFQPLIDLGFSGDDLRQLVTSNACVIFSYNIQRKVVPRIELWRKLLGSNGQLLKHLPRNPWILGYAVEKMILPNIALLDEYGISDRSLSSVLKNQPLLIAAKPARLKDSLDYVIELGVPRNCKMLLWALSVIQNHGVKGFEAKMQVMISLGWSQSEFICAFRKAPCFINVSQKVLQRKMEFFVGELGCDPSYVAKYPLLLMFGLEKRLIPRHRVMEALKTKGLHSSNYKLSTIMTISEQKFMERYVLPYMEEVPELLGLFVTGCKKNAISDSKLS